MRTLEKSLTTSYPFHAKSRFCQLPQINYQGGNRCGQTPNWLLKCPFFSFFFPPVLLRLVLQLLLSPLHRKLGAESITVLTLNMCLAHYKHSLASLYKLFLPPPERNTDCRSRFCPPVSCGIQFPVRARVAISEIGYGSIVTA